MVCLMALQIMSYEKIAPKDVLMLSVRHYHFPDMPELNRIRKQDYSFFDGNRGLSSLRRMLLQLPCIGHFRALLRRADQSIIDAIGIEPFRLYTFHSQSINIEIMISMLQCREYSFVEEGTLSYAITPELNIVHRTFRKHCYDVIQSILLGFRTGYMAPFFIFDISNKKFRTIYCCGKDAFRGFPNRVCIGLPFRKQAGIPDDLSVLIVFDGGIIPMDQQKDSLEKDIYHAIKVLHCSVLYFKFHPAQKETVRQIYRKFFKEQERQHHVLIKELPDEVVLENLVFTLKDKLAVYIICSSVGAYARLCGSNVFSTAQHYVSGNPELQWHFDTYGYIFSQYNAI